MTEQTGFPPESQTQELERLRAQLAAQQAQITPPQAQQAAAQQLQAQAEIAGDSDTVAAQTMEQMREQVTREVLLPMEAKMDDLIVTLKAQSDAQAAQIKALQGQLTQAQLAVGPPDVIKYSQAVAERLATAAATAGLPKQHWAGVLAAADQLAAAAKDAAQSGDGSKLPDLVRQVEHFVTRGHTRAGGGHVEHFPALLGDLEELGAAALKLAPLAA